MTARRLWIIVLVLAALTPLGLWLPARFGAGDAWGEWSADDVGEQVGFIPRGLARLSDLWPAPAPDYAPRGWEDKPLAVQGASYIFSAILGLIVCGGLMWLLGRWLTGREARNAP
jgi:hypothetical protein